MKSSDKLKTIIALAKRGMKILPLKPKGKKPIHEGGVHNATADVEALKRYFRWHRNANYGIATGQESTVIVLDVDGKPGKKSIRALTATHGKLPKTVKVKTGKGFHYYFQPSEAPVRNS